MNGGFGLYPSFLLVFVFCYLRDIEILTIALLLCMFCPTQVYELLKKKSV